MAPLGNEDSRGVTFQITFLWRAVDVHARNGLRTRQGALSLSLFSSFRSRPSLIWRTWRDGAAFEASVDVVACNFPTWQCSLFMYVNVAVVMRFTHRWDHHLQSYYADPGVASRPGAAWSEPVLARR